MNARSATAVDQKSAALMPLVSIVIPCFNAESTVREAIQSALDQDYPNCEVIVIDDGSTDQSVDVIRTFGESIRWETGPNRGGNVARNRGLELARGTLIQFLDSDDVLYRNRISAMVPAVKENGPAVLVVSGWDLRSENQQDLVSKCPDYTGGDPLVWLLSHELQTSAPLHWKSVLESIGGFDPDLKRCQEFELHLRMFSMGIRLQVLKLCLYQWRRQSESVSSDWSKILVTKQKILKDLLERLSGMPENSQRISAVSRQVAIDGRWLVRFDRAEEAEASFSLADAYDGAALDRAFPEPYLRPLLCCMKPVHVERFRMLLHRLFRKP